VLLDAWPVGVQAKTKEGCDTPLHIALWKEAPLEVIQLLLEEWPEGAQETDRKGSTPLHLGMKHKAPPAAIQLLLDAWHVLGVLLEVSSLLLEV
jgi:hypothetical protein